MKFIMYSFLLSLLLLISIINAQQYNNNNDDINIQKSNYLNSNEDNIRFLVNFNKCGVSVTVGVNECISIDACGYDGFKVIPVFASQGDYQGNLYTTKCLTFAVDSFFIMCESWSSLSSEIQEDITYKCDRPGVSGESSVSSTTSSGISLHSVTTFVSSVSHVVSSLSTIVSSTSAAAASSTTTTGGSTISSATTIITAASSLSSAVSSTTSAASSTTTSSTSSSTTGGGTGVPGSNCIKNIAKSQLTVTYTRETPYIECSGDMDLSCGNDTTCFNQNNSTISCYGIESIQCTGTSIICQISGVTVCEFNWNPINNSTSNDDDSNSNSTSKKSLSTNSLQYNNQSFTITLIIILSIYLILSI